MRSKFLFSYEECATLVGNVCSFQHRQETQKRKYHELTCYKVETETISNTQADKLNLLSFSPPSIK